MTQVSMYELTVTPLEKTLPKLMEKVFESGKNSIIMASSEDRVENLNNILWTFSTLTFLPHGSKKDGFADLQPIWLTTQQENPNEATVMVLTDGAQHCDLEKFERCLDIFDGSEEDGVSKAHQRIQEYIAQGHTVAYWKQDLKGKWESKEL